MSMFEHLNHKKYGFAEAKNKTLVMSRAAFAGECDNLVISKTKEYVALVPFFVVALAVFVASEEASFITGSDFVIDGGLLAV